MEDNSIKKILILGVGWVGRQVAARLAQQGKRVWLMDQNPEITSDAIRWIESTDQPVEAKDNWIENIQATPSLGEVSQTEARSWNIDLIIESVSEQLSVKRRVLAKASGLFPSPTILASNSSYFVPSLFTPHIQDPNRYAHLHFHVPVLRDSVVDVVGCELADTQVVPSLESFVREIGLSAIVLRREHPGYVFNWMLQAFLQSALELVALDIVDVEDVDRSWRSVTGMELGPFQIMDQIGLDVIEQVLANGRWSPPPDVDAQQLLEMLQEKTNAGHLGRKSLQGFYCYDDDHKLLDS